MDEKLTEDILKLLEKRPIELNHEYSFIKQEEKEALLKNNNDIEYLNETRNTPLKVVLMGEVKAGKSTLLNAIAGEELSPVGVTETTAVIMEIAHGKEKQGTILKKDGTSEKMDTDRIYQVLEQNQDNQDFFAGIEMIRLHYPLETLKEISIVDTPGIETITSANQETTKDFIQKADVVIWVLSVHHLGQVGIDDEIMEVAEYGKPIIMLVNRIDQANEDAEVIMDFIDETYGFYVEAAFPVSGFKAFEGKKNRNKGLYDESGLAEVLTYLEQNIDVAAEKVKKESVSASVFQIVQKEILFSKVIIEEISFVIESVNRRKEDSDYFQHKINSVIKQDAESWLENEFLQKEKTAILTAISANSKAILKDNTGEIKKMMAEYYSEKYVTASLQELWIKLRDYSEKERVNALKVMGENFKKEEEKHFEKFSFRFVKEFGEFSLNQNEDTLTGMVEGAKKGVFVGGAYGLAAATYSAVLGPYAAAITIGTALGSVLPPVLIVGAVTGAAIKFVNKDKKIKELNETTYKLFEEVKGNVGQVLNEMVDQLTTSNEEYFEGIYQQLGKFILKGNTYNELTSLKNEMDIYTNELSENLSMIKTQKNTAEIIKGNFTGERNASQSSPLTQEPDSSDEVINVEEEKTIDDKINDLFS